MSNLWSNERVRLRTMEETDVHLFTNQNGDYDTALMKRYDVVEFPLSAAQLSARTAEFFKTRKNDDYLFVIETPDRIPAGVLTVFDTDPRMGTFKYGLFVKEEFRGMGLAKEAAHLALSYYFRELRYHKCNVYIYEFNAPSLGFHEKLGFVKEGQLRDMVYTDGRYYDTVYMGITAEEWNTK